MDREGAVLTDEEKTSDMEFSDSLLFNPSTQKFYYLDGSVSANVFDCTFIYLFLLLALLKQDVELRSSYLSPGYFSSGNTPCSFDSMTEEELHAIGKKKKNCGFKGTVRCYLERITSILSDMKWIVDDEKDSLTCHMVREDTGKYLLSGWSSLLVIIPSGEITEVELDCFFYE